MRPERAHNVGCRFGEGVPVTKKAQHTPLPWTNEGYDDEGGHWVVVATGTDTEPGEWVCDVRDEETAEFITRACNSHYDLVEALDFVTRQLDYAIQCIPAGSISGHSTRDAVGRGLRKAVSDGRAALAKARGES